MKTIAYSKAAQKTLTRLPVNTAKLIRSKIEQFAAEPSSLANNVKALKGDIAGFRLRVGDYRIRFRRVGEEVVQVVRVLHRREVYRV